MAHRKPYYPNRVTGVERLAFQLSGDPKIRTIEIKSAGKRQPIALKAFVSKSVRHDRIKLF